MQTTGGAFVVGEASSKESMKKENSLSSACLWLSSTNQQIFKKPSFSFIFQ